MEIWNSWTAFLASSIEFLSIHLGVSEAIAIILFTLLARTLLMPISLKSAYSMHRNKLAMEKMKPELERLKDRYKDDPAQLAQRTMEIYRKRGIKILDRTTAINIGSQGVLGLGIFQALKSMPFSSKFMWIADLAKPDVLLAILVGILTFLSMQLMPGAAEQQNYLIYLAPALVSVFVLVSFPSALGLYWATSSLVTVVQTFGLRLFVLKATPPTGGT